MTAVFYKGLALVIVVLLYIIPFVYCAITCKLKVNFSLRNFIRVANFSGIFYLCIFVLMVFIVMGGTLIADPEYPDAGELLTGGVIIGFMMSSLIVFLPVLLILNWIAYLRTKRSLLHNRGKLNN